MGWDSLGLLLFGLLDMCVGAGFGEELEGGASWEVWIFWVKVFGVGPGCEFALEKRVKINGEVE